MRGLVWLLAGMFAGCAHTPIVAERQVAFFGCSLVLPEAERNLALAGFAIEHATAQSITTHYVPMRPPV